MDGMIVCHKVSELAIAMLMIAGGGGGGGNGSGESGGVAVGYGITVPEKEIVRTCNVHSYLDVMDVRAGIVMLHNLLELVISTERVHAHRVPFSGCSSSVLWCVWLGVPLSVVEW